MRLLRRQAESCAMVLFASPSPSDGPPALPSSSNTHGQSQYSSTAPRSVRLKHVRVVQPHLHSRSHSQSHSHSQSQYSSTVPPAQSQSQSQSQSVTVSHSQLQYSSTAMRCRPAQTRTSLSFGTVYKGSSAPRALLRLVSATVLVDRVVVVVVVVYCSSRWASEYLCTL
eukprot:2879934-Pyramimonas_sp.AAC.1